MPPISSSIWTTPDRLIEGALRGLVFASLLTCVFDIYLTVKYADQLILEETELNQVALAMIAVRTETKTYPVGDMLHETDRVVVFRTADESRLVLFKSFGLMASFYVFEWCFRTQSRRVSAAVVITIFLLQLLLLSVLML